MAKKNLPDGRRRVVLERASPELDAGRFAIKRTIGETVIAQVDAFTDGHDHLSCLLQYRKEEEPTWHEVVMTPLGNDRWQGEFVVTALGRYHYTFSAWVDHFTSWRQELIRRVNADDIALALRTGAELVESAAKRAKGADAQWLRARAKSLAGDHDQTERLQLALSNDLQALMNRYADRRFVTQYPHELVVIVDDERARFSTWYEVFPRSCSAVPGQHGTFKDVERWLPRIADMGFDVLYFPPIHPIGRINRKGKNNTLTAEPEDVGSPWAIGAEEGGHKAVHPQLGTLDDFRALVQKARNDYRIDIALDIAFQCAPDHPYVKAHPDWFKIRPDGSIQYAENPPKKYQDIYPFNFESNDWQGLWQELKSIVEFWVEQGVRIFRVDNPHTKSFAMWEWLIGEIKKMRPDAIFLAEAFTRPKVMHNLAKLGYTQSYTYFTWRNSKAELIEYLTELTQGPGREYFRPNFWPNTPDILHEYLQYGGRPAFIIRLVLAATLTANYGIYGPAYELLENTPLREGSEEYLDSEKYQLRHRDLTQEGNLTEFIGLVNRIRRRNPALQQDWTLHFHEVDNDRLLCYSKTTEDFSDVVLVVVNLDVHHTQAGWVTLHLDALGLKAEQSFQVHDLLGDQHYLWQGARNYVELNPQQMPAHIFRLHRRTRTERDFDYFGPVA